MLLSLITLALIELFFFLTISWLRKDFQWLITAKRDLHPTLSNDKIDNFFKESFDPELGWIRKANSSGKESTKSIGDSSELQSWSQFSINHKGHRNNPGHEELPVEIVTFGDSFVFSRQVNDDQTWQHELSQLTQTNVTNAGVGNHGADQALLRFRREINGLGKPRMAILGAVPETLCRVHNYWKHYFEYGNVLAFKPRFEWDNSGGLVEVPLLVRDKQNFLKVLQDHSQAQKHDLWFHRKFKRDLLGFPYSISIWKNPKRNLSLIWTLLLSKWKSSYKSRAWEIILKQNLLHCKSAYREPDSIQLLIEIVANFTSDCLNRGILPVYVIFPYLEDLKDRAEGEIYYENFKCKLKQRCEKLVIIDLSDEMAKVKDPVNLYINAFYGAHFSHSGNKLAAQIIHRELKL